MVHVICSFLSTKKCFEIADSWMSQAYTAEAVKEIMLKKTWEEGVFPKELDQ